MHPRLIDDLKGFPEDDAGALIEFSAGVLVVSGEGTGPGNVELYEGEHTAGALRERLEAERCNGDRWAYAQPVDATMREERYEL